MSEYDEFQEIAHCGGQVTIHISCDDQGRRSVGAGFRHSRPTPASVIGIYALIPHGIPVADLHMGRMGQSGSDCPQHCFPVFLGSDSRLCWGHQCSRCQGYFRNSNHPAIYPLTCPYCGLRAPAHTFLTPAQRKYVRHFINMVVDALDAEMAVSTERELVLDMDAVVAQDSGQPRPDFYYAAETQQTRYNCEKCGEFNDIRGRYGYCAACGWRNNVPFLRSSFAELRSRLNKGQISSADCVRAAISEFDACCRDYVKQISMRIPMKHTRRSALDRLVFHDIEATAIVFMKSALDIDFLRGLENEAQFVKMMMHRRHVFEHNAGVADRRYVELSGDSNAREGVLIRETQQNAHQLVSVLMKMGQNLDRDFHEIFEPTEGPIKFHQKAQGRIKHRIAAKDEEIP
jgi:hypothetical protein